jgi:hypothetical protein
MERVIIFEAKATFKVFYVMESLPLRINPGASKGGFSAKEY